MSAQWSRRTQATVGMGFLAGALVVYVGVHGALVQWCLEDGLSPAVWRKVWPCYAPRDWVYKRVPVVRESLDEIDAWSVDAFFRLRGIDPASRWVPLAPATVTGGKAEGKP